MDTQLNLNEIPEQQILSLEFGDFWLSQNNQRVPFKAVDLMENVLDDWQSRDRYLNWQKELSGVIIIFPDVSNLSFGKPLSISSDIDSKMVEHVDVVSDEFYNGSQYVFKDTRLNFGVAMFENDHGYDAAGYVETNGDDKLQNFVNYGWVNLNYPDQFKFVISWGNLQNKDSLALDFAIDDAIDFRQVYRSRD